MEFLGNLFLLLQKKTRREGTSCHCHLPFCLGQIFTFCPRECKYLPSHNHKGDKSLKVKERMMEGAWSIDACTPTMGWTTIQTTCYVRLRNTYYPSHKTQVLCSVQFSSVTQSCLTLCGPVDCSTPGFPVYHQLVLLMPHRIIFTGHYQIST